MSMANVEMKQEECCNCHMTFWVPKSFHQQCREQGKHKTFYCPAGHPMVYSGETEADRERRLRQRAEQETARLEEEALAARIAQAAAERARQTAECALKTHKTRAANGTCPCCNRTFANMTKHMKTKHPNYNVVPLKAAKA